MPRDEGGRGGPGTRAQSREEGGRARSVGAEPQTGEPGGGPQHRHHGGTGPCRGVQAVGGPAMAPAPNPQQRGGRPRGGSRLRAQAERGYGETGAERAGCWALCALCGRKPERGAGSQAGCRETLGGPASALTCSPRAPAWPPSPLLTPTGSAPHHHRALSPPTHTHTWPCPPHTHTPGPALHVDTNNHRPHCWARGARRALGWPPSAGLRAVSPLGSWVPQRVAAGSALCTRLCSPQPRSILLHRGPAEARRGSETGRVPGPAGVRDPRSGETWHCPVPGAPVPG